MSFATILVVDDEASSRNKLGDMIEDLGHTPVLARDAVSARARLSEFPPDLVVADLHLPDTTTADLLKEIRSGDPALPVAVVAGPSSVDAAVEAIQDGAYDYIPRPFSGPEVERILRKGLRIRKGLGFQVPVAPYCTQLLSFRIPSRASLLEGILTVVSSSLGSTGNGRGHAAQHVCLCLEEAIENAILHGNRLEESRSVHVSVQIAPGSIQATVEDEGEGFDFAPYTVKENLGKVMRWGCHGLFLILCLMDRVMFNPRGNAITLVKYFPAR